MTYASNILSVSEVLKSSRIDFEKVNIGNQAIIDKLLIKFQPDYIINLAAETHVDNSIKRPESFVQTNIVDTHKFLVSINNFYNTLGGDKKKKFRILHVSTDEVYGEIPVKESPVDERYRYNPSSPYSASKAASDHLFKSYFKTFGLPIIISNCSNNYGPFQHKEKLIPTIIRNLIKKNKIPIYGNGLQKRDWLFVDDHCLALVKILYFGLIGESYNIGSGKELTNLDLVETILKLLKKKNIIKIKDDNSHIINVTDRLGHDLRYSIDSSKLRNSLNWEPKNTLIEGLNITIDHYLRRYGKVY